MVGLQIIKGLAEIGATKATSVVIIAGDTKRSAMSVGRIAPVVIVVDPSVIEAAGIDPVGIAAVTTIHLAGQGGAGAPADDDAGNCRVGTVALSGRIADEAADQRPDQNPGRIRSCAAFAIIDIVIVAIGAAVALIPIPFAIVKEQGIGDQPA
jgi:hypothetical protein